jgi:hypothetical protein
LKQPMSEYQIKLEATEEYKQALRYKMMNEELCSSLLGLLSQLTRYYEKSGMEMPAEVARIMVKTSEALDARIVASNFAPTQTK